MGFKGKPGLGVITGLDPVCPQCGPYEASEGIYPGHGQIKNWGWARWAKILTGFEICFNFFIGGSIKR